MAGGIPQRAAPDLGEALCGLSATLFARKHQCIWGDAEYRQSAFPGGRSGSARACSPRQGGSVASALLLLKG